ncbi:nuclease-related domain-containing protein [Psychrobacter celer]|uniref:nuclease-related domain-containing protein n=1 Tax=Psychrobacter celer TaxID=306572 RepID=UPI003FD22F04
MSALKGFIGEMKLRLAMFFLLGSQYKVLSNVTARFDNGATSQVDHVVVSPYGIFVIEVKNYSGNITINENSSCWTQSFGHASYDFYNPLMQNNGHLGVLRYLLKSKDYPMINILSFVGDATFENSAIPSCMATSVYDTIRLIKSYKDRVISPADIIIAYKHIETRRMPNTWRTKRIHLKNVRGY